MFRLTFADGCNGCGYRETQGWEGEMRGEEGRGEEGRGGKRRGVESADGTCMIKIKYSHF